MRSVLSAAFLRENYPISAPQIPEGLIGGRDPHSMGHAGYRSGTTFVGRGRVRTRKLCTKKGNSLRDDFCRSGSRNFWSVILSEALKARSQGTPATSFQELR